MYLKGKTVRKTPRAVVEQTFTIPEELKSKCSNITLHMDILFISGIAFLTTIGHPTYYRTYVPLQSENADDVYDALDKTLRAYNHNKFLIRKVECDG